MAVKQGGKSKKSRSERAKLIAGRSYRRAQERHESLAAQQELAHRRNFRLVKDGELLPWEQACLDRARRREEEGLYQLWADVHKDAAKAQAQLREEFLRYIAA